MSAVDWRDEQARSLCVRLAGDAIDETDERGRGVFGDTLLVLLNAHHRPVSFHLPAHREDVYWEQVFDTREPAGRRKTRRLVKGGASYRTESHSLALFRLQAEVEATSVEDGQEGEARTGLEATEPALALTAAATGGPLTQSVYCARAETIVPLDEGFCRACSRQVAQDDGIHHEPTPEVLKRMGYVTTTLPETEAQGEETPGDESQSEEG